ADKLRWNTQKDLEESKKEESMKAAAAKKKSDRKVDKSNRHPPLQLENLNLLISQQRQSYQAERNGAPNPKHVIPTTKTAKRKADQIELQELVVIEDDDSELNHPPSNSPETSRSASSTIKELLQTGEARIQELSDQLKREQDRVDLLKKGATTFGEEFIFGSFFC
ncbi:hypothetical protein PROFUN_14239, partial [Planoprotostelium fungivorum]